MVVIPKERPVVEKLNSYYLHLRKLFEHYQGELGCGAIRFKSPFGEGIIFFDKDELLNGWFRDDNNHMKGKNAIEYIFGAAEKHNFTVSIYQIDPAHIYFWANVPDAVEVYGNLSSEFTDLSGLVEKMRKEKLTGFINVSIRNGTSGGLIFFNGGKVVGGSFAWPADHKGDFEEGLSLLVEKSKDIGATFSVNKIVPASEKLSVARGSEAQKCSWHLITALEECLAIFEKVVNAEKAYRGQFRTLLKKKFLDKAEKYEFLDPFAAEFEYVNHKITFVGNASEEEVVRGVIESVRELAEEIGLLPAFLDALELWKDQYGRTISKFGVSLE